MIRMPVVYKGNLTPDVSLTRVFAKFYFSLSHKLGKWRKEESDGNNSNDQTKTCTAVVR